MTKIEKIKKVAHAIAGLGVGVIVNGLVGLATKDSGKIGKLLAGIGGIAILLSLQKPTNNAIDDSVDEIVNDLAELREA